MASTGRSDRPRQRRAFHVKSRAGCKTCRVRHVKCDETRPSCNNCKRLGFQCEGSPARPFTFVDSRPAILQRVRSSGSVFVDGKEMSMFQYFMERTILWFVPPSEKTQNDIGIYYCGSCYEFWNPFALQLMHHEPVMKHLVLATSAAWSREYGDTLSNSAERDLFFYQHYGKALKQLAKNTTDISVVLTACCILCVVEAFCHNTENFLRHLHSGMSILENYRQTFAREFPGENEPWLSQRKNDPSHDRINKTIVPVLAALERNAGWTLAPDSFSIRAKFEVKEDGGHADQAEVDKFEEVLQAVIKNAFEKDNSIVPTKMKPVITIPAIAALVYKAWSRKSLTPVGIVVAFGVAVIHAIHPWSAPFALLVVFFLGGTQATKGKQVKHDIKATLTLSSTGSSGGEGPRTHIQVLANSLMASLLIIPHTYLLRSRSDPATTCLPLSGDSLALTAGIVANYAAVAADTFSSELGILSKSRPRLITTLKPVPPGTNGGVTTAGLLAGAFGAFTIALTSVLLLPFCAKSPGPVGRVLMANETRGWGWDDKIVWVLAVTVWGALGSVLDSFFGAILQASVVDKRTGKIIEGSGGVKVMTSPPRHSEMSPPTSVDTAAAKKRTSGTRPSEKDAASVDQQQHHESRSFVNGFDILDNNHVNLLMAAIMSLGATAVVKCYMG